ncbi:metalloregulator ArsR/SmtB family transcription factor [Nonomuraea sp. NPDC050310]|uniref:ArsR/SmtB family transcription factor n=1 Tax=unclassified Nonomuraea TaxID=2593643 RepID=UPI0033F6DAED
MSLLPQPATTEIQLTEVLRALADPVRLDLVARLDRDGEETCFRLGVDTGLHKSTMSHHYRILREAGVVLTRQDGRRKYLSLRRADLEERFPGLLDSVLAAALDRTP